MAAPCKGAGKPSGRWSIRRGDHAGSGPSLGLAFFPFGQPAGLAVFEFLAQLQGALGGDFPLPLRPFFTKRLLVGMSFLAGQRIGGQCIRALRRGRGQFQMIGGGIGHGHGFALVGFLLQL